MGDVVNLRRAKKAKARADKEAGAAANRALFSTPRATRAITTARSEKEKADLAGKKLDEA
jgi:hypothetical protein